MKEILLHNPNPNVLSFIQNTRPYSRSVNAKRIKLSGCLEELLDSCSRNDWNLLSKNPNMVQVLEQNLDKIGWCSLSSNPKAISILEQNLDKVSWFAFCENPEAIHVLEKKTLIN